MEIEKVGRDCGGQSNDDDDNNARNMTNSNKDQRKGGSEEEIGSKTNRDKDTDDEKEGEEEADDGEGNPRIALLKGLWALAKHERVLDILRLQACVEGEGENESVGKEKEEDERNEQSHRYKHHQSVMIYAEDALRAWRYVERRMRVRRAV